MFISFRTFRKIILGTILLVSTASLGLSLYLKPYLIHRNSAYVLAGILDTVILTSTLALTRRSLLDSPQSVAMETLGLFTLLPFALILTLYVLSLSVTPEPTTLSIFAILQILVFIGTTLHALYTLGLILTAMLTVCAFDRDVWSRHIDSSPSPFPMTFLFLFIFPCFSQRDTTSFPTEDAPVLNQERVVCLPGCNCSIAKTEIPNTSPGLEPNMQMVSGLSSRSLVRVPNDIERRTSIAIAFEV
ncbi:hypothetical protein DFH07DRAFT_183591 [Mycena maculata]|uniref:Uncharacterized protein n=1 Tax=Mycena maculata TaxID=230809 RepID=A0AAD7HVW9_9AGAR|nr:hypothetical protein DFH07DRAFT_183591 [Mycena maculata]